MYYVYALINPINKKPFYIGKGKNNRIAAHEKEALKNMFSDKCDVIREIWNSGLEVEKRILKYFESEDDAYSYEKRLIKKIGLKNLTNISHGGKIPFPCKDKIWEHDAIVVKLYKNILNLELNGLIPCIRLLGLHEIPKYALDSFKNQAKVIINKRGETWVLKVLSTC